MDTDKIRRGAITEIYKRSNRELAAEVDALKALVREMWKALDGSSVFMIRLQKNLLHPDSIKFGAGVLSHGIEEILNRPEVKKILEEEK